MPPDDPAGAVPPRWIHWASRLRALAQNGREHSTNPFDQERYHELEGIAAEILASESSGDFERSLAQFRAEVGYATPKVDVRGVVFRGERLLFVKERADGRWALPGGWADIGATAGENVVKEIEEESGYLTRPVKLLAVWDGRLRGHPPYPYPFYKLFIRCELLGGEARSSHETAEAVFFAQSEVPELSTGRVTAEELARIFQHRLNPDWPTDYD